MANNNSTRTMAFQIGEDLFQRIKAYLERETARTSRKLTQREFVLTKARLVEQRDDAHRAEAEIQAELFELTRDRSIYVEQYQRYTDMGALPSDAIADLLDHVTVWPDSRLDVSLKFLNELPFSTAAEWETKITE